MYRLRDKITPHDLEENPGKNSYGAPIGDVGEDLTSIHKALPYFSFLLLLHHRLDLAFTVEQRGFEHDVLLRQTVDRLALDSDDALHRDLGALWLCHYWPTGF